jgi:hypothetical protein
MFQILCENKILHHPENNSSSSSARYYLGDDALILGIL